MEVPSGMAGSRGLGLSLLSLFFIGALPMGQVLSKVAPGHHRIIRLV